MNSSRPTGAMCYSLARQIPGYRGYTFLTNTPDPADPSRPNLFGEKMFLSHWRCAPRRRDAHQAGHQRRQPAASNSQCRDRAQPADVAGCRRLSRQSRAPACGRASREKYAEYLSRTLYPLANNFWEERFHLSRPACRSSRARPAAARTPTVWRSSRILPATTGSRIFPGRCERAAGLSRGVQRNICSDARHPRLPGRHDRDHPAAAGAEAARHRLRQSGARRIVAALCAAARRGDGRRGAYRHVDQLRVVLHRTPTPSSLITRRRRARSCSRSCRRTGRRSATRAIASSA